MLMQNVKVKIQNEKWGSVDKSRLSLACETGCRLGQGSVKISGNAIVRNEKLKYWHALLFFSGVRQFF